MLSMLSMLSLLLLPLAALCTSDVLDPRLSNGVVHLTDDLIDRVFKAPRDYHLVMLMTGEGANVDCGFCDVLGGNFRTVAASYDAGLHGGEREVYFAIADFENCMGSFRKLGLQQVPNVAVWAPSQSRADAKLGVQAKHMFMSFKSSGDQEEVLQTMLKNLGFDVKIVKPFPLNKFLKFVGTLVAAGAGAFVMRAQVLRVWQAKQIWLALSLMAVVMFISGHMFNVTRGTAFMGRDGDHPKLVDPSFNTQFAVETQIVAVLYAVLAFTAIGLIKFVPRIADAKGQTAGAIFGAVTILVVYSVYLNLFSTKMGGFHLTLLPLHLF